MVKQRILFRVKENSKMQGSIPYAACVVRFPEGGPAGNSGNSSDDAVQVRAALWHMSGRSTPWNAAPHLQLHRSPLPLGCKLRWVTVCLLLFPLPVGSVKNTNGLLADKNKRIFCFFSPVPMVSVKNTHGLLANKNKPDLVLMCVLLFFINLLCKWCAATLYYAWTRLLFFKLGQAQCKYNLLLLLLNRLTENTIRKNIKIKSE